MNEFVKQLEQVLADQKRELSDVNAQLSENARKNGDLLTEKQILVKSIQKTEQTLEELEGGF